MDFNTIICLICLFILIILHVWVSLDMMLDKTRKKDMNICIAMVNICVVIELVYLFIDNSVPELRLLNIILYMIYLSVLPFVLIVESHFYNRIFHKGHFLCYVPATINAILVALTPFTKMIFYVTADNQYYRGEYYYLFIIAFAFSVMYSLYKKNQSIRYLPPNFFYRIVISSLLLYPFFFIQVIFPEYKISLLILTIHLLLCLNFTAQMDGLLDNLTGLLNRNSFNRYIEILRTVKNKRHTVIVYDVDRFKELNDVKGHLQGDEYLILISNVLKEVYKSRIYRYGGDEFIVFMKTLDQDKVNENIKLFIQKITALREVDKDVPTLSYGYAVYRDDRDIDDVLHEADLLMYKYKNTH